MVGGETGQQTEVQQFTKATLPLEVLDRISGPPLSPTVRFETYQIVFCSLPFPRHLQLPSNQPSFTAPSSVSRPERIHTNPSFSLFRSLIRSARLSAREISFTWLASLSIRININMEVHTRIFILAFRTF
jgi:hypothetical protein